MDRRRLLLVAQGWTLAAAATLGILTFFNVVTPWLLLFFIFILGMGAVFTAPAWQAIVPELVDRTLCTAMFAGGVAWIAVVSSFNVAAQTAAASHFTYADGKQTGKDAGRRSLDES